MKNLAGDFLFHMKQKRNGLNQPIEIKIENSLFVKFSSYRNIFKKKAQT